MKKRRTISNDKQLLNLFIRYKRDYIKDNDFENIKAITEESSLKIKLYFEPIQFDNDKHKMLSKQFKELQNSIKNEKDGRKLKSLKNQLNKLKPYKERYDEIVKSQSRGQAKSKFLSKIIEPFDDKERIDFNPEAYNSIYDSWEESNIIEIDNIWISPKEILEFDYHLILLSELFSLKINNKEVSNALLSLLPVQIEEGDLSESYLDNVSQWINKSKRVDKAIEYLLNSGYIKLSRKRALKVVTNEDAKWLLSACIKYEERNNSKITLKRDNKNYNIKSKILHQIFKKRFDIKTAETITKYSSLI